MVVAVTGYQALHEHAAVIDLRTRGKIQLTGEDRARLLHAMTTNHIQQLKPGEICYAFFLNAQGRILADANILCFENEMWLDTEPETAEKLLAHLRHFTIADDVAITDYTAELATLALEGPKAAEVLAATGAPVPAAGFVEWDNATIARLDATGAGGFFLFVAPEAVETWIARFGVPVATAEEARTVRIEHARPRYGEEITDRYLVHETQQLQAVHFSKGCYLGQEIVERVRSRAQIHRKLMPLAIYGTEVPEPGAKLQAGGQDRAEIVSAAYSPAWGKVAAMAYVRTEAAREDAVLTLAGRPAVVRRMPNVAAEVCE